MEFQKWSKIPRLNREMILTEKIDGTNSQVYIEHNEIVDSEFVIGPETADMVRERTMFRDNDITMFCGSRKRYLTRKEDNFGFAKFVEENAEELMKLGPGRHYGEWWGQGIQRNYGRDHRVFSLFNVRRWHDYALPGEQGFAPVCCDIVPTLYRGPFDNSKVIEEINRLVRGGSEAAPGFMKPEGVIVFLIAANKAFKVTCEKDEQRKGDKR